MAFPRGLVATSVARSFISLVASPLRAEEAPGASPPPPPADAPAQSSTRVRPSLLQLPDVSLIGNFAAAWFSDEPAPRGGHEPTGGAEAVSAALQEAELAIQAAIDPFLRADGFFSFHADGVEVEELYVTTLAMPLSLQLRGGQFLTPFGRDNALHLEQWTFADRPLTTRHVLDSEGISGVGAEVSWLAPTPFFLELRAGAQRLGAEEEGEEGHAHAAGVGEALGFARVSTFAEASSALSILPGISVARTEDATLLGADVYLKLRAPEARTYWAWQTEYVRSEADDHVLGGLYTQLVRRFSRRVEAAVRFDRLGLPARDALPLEDAVARSTRISGQLSLYPSEFSRLRLQAARHGLGDRAVTEAFLQLEFNVGPHGAHPF